MKETRRLRIIKTVRRIVRYQLPITRSYCLVCAREVEIFGATQAAALLETDLANFNCLLAAGRLHVIVTASGNLCICKNSLFLRISPNDYGTAHKPP